jgi:immune inhibitor A
LNELRESLEEARKWGLDAPHPGLKFDASKYGASGAKRNALVILVDFTDKRGAVPPENIHNLLFSEGTYSTGSMRDFYLENSYGTLEVSGQVVGWLRSEREYSYYVDGARGLNFGNGDRNARGMAEEALRLADPLVDFSAFDNDGPDGIPSSGDDDGYVDALLIVHAGPGSEETLDRNDILSHQSYFEDDVLCDGVRAILYTTEPENGRVGVFCHEFGHTLGLPDLYDISDFPGPAVGVGDWSLMGTGSWRNDGRTPAHLDAWCKVKLGFVDPVVPEENEPHVTLPPVEIEPVIYKIWTNGSPGPEYFLAEYRSERGFDSALPGFGMLLYHVDEAVRLQTDPERYKVAVVQADGSRHLETQFGNYGDTGDPFPGAAVKRSFTPFSDPNSLDYDGEDTQVWLSEISFDIPVDPGDDDYEIMTFGLEVETGPKFVFESATVDDRDGDGDGFVDYVNREWGHVEAVVKNIGLDATGVEVSIEFDEREVDISPSSFVIGSVDADSSFTIAFDFRGAEVLYTRPPPPAAAAAFNLKVVDDGVASWCVDFAVGVGTEYGHAYEDACIPWWWWYFPGPDGQPNAWDLTSIRPRTGDCSWSFTTPSAGYPNDSDGSLISPAVILAPNSQLSLFYWVEAETLGSSIAWDGARIEMSNNGQPWIPIEPAGGYDFALFEFSDTPIHGSGVFSGSRDWTRAVVDLSEYSGVAQFRFRFVSDGSVALEGFYMDDFAVVARDYVSAIESLGDTPDGVEIEVGVTEVSGPYDGQGFNIYRKREGARASAPVGLFPPGYEKLNATLLYPEAGRLSYLDATAERGRTYLYIVEDLGPEGPGAPWLIGPERIYLCLGASRPFLLNPYPVPFVPGGGRAIKLPVGVPDPECAEAGGPASAYLFDAAGRLVKKFSLQTVGPGVGEILWDGTNSDGDTVRSGVYFWRVEISGEVLTSKVIIVR